MLQSCPRLANWGLWSACTASCDGGLSLRVRDCVNGFIGEAGCESEVQQSRQCNAEVSKKLCGIFVI